MRITIHIVMYRLTCTLILILFITVVQNDTNNNFGPYEMIWESFNSCKGPKRSDCGRVKIENTVNMSDVIFVLDIPKDCPVTKAKVIIGTRQSNNSTKKLWNYSLDTPCEHFVLGPILIESFNLTNNCKVNKGYYEVHINMKAKASMFLGTSFFYGDYVFKVFAHNKNNNFFCAQSILSVEKKNP